MPKTKLRHGLIAALDVGTTKVCCFIARANDDGNMRIVGIGHQLSRGMRNGAVVDMEEAETAIRAAVDAAEQMAEDRVREVVVNVSGGQPTSNNVTVEVSVNGHEIGDQDIRRMLDHARHHAQSTDRDLIHSIPVGFTVDGNEGIRDPRGMFGESLAVTIHLVSANPGPVRNLSTVVHRCHLDIESRVASAYASGLSCLVDDERDLGVTCIDMGGGTTTIAVFQGAHLMHTDTIPVGGVHVTNDIARGLSTPLVHAERMKTLYGSALPSPSDDREILKVPLVGEDEDGATNQVPRSMLVQIIQPRLEETFELVRSHLEAGGFDKIAGRRVVLTGGAAQMQGVRDLAAMVLDKQVRLGRPIGMQGLPEATNGPAFSTCAGLLRYAVLNTQTETPSKSARARQTDDGGNRLAKLGAWLRKNF
ncbi:cell division protein FtsA [Telmatospirillum sp.]|uniref:cell division protein FtsA n=1 Tax=Telmatospirillum sp. TaxID=2079197 RepID=UPI0028462BDC|nr:cell division protein FtsA [Telmatospirillum sp.]MDR3435796.1 cell division protein FtsA [Telmatospirillum sp.]